MRDLPPGWVWATFGEVGTWLGGGTPSKARSAYWDDGTIPWLSPKDMRSPVLVTTQDHITQAAVDGSATRLVPAPSVAVVFRSGILEHSLPVALVQFATTLNQDMKALVPYWDSGARWIHYALTANADSILESCRKRGTTVASIEFSRFLDFRIPIAPYSEQRRIVEALEAHLSHLDAGTADLNSAVERARQLMHALATRTGSGSAPAEQQGATSSVTTDVSALARRSPLTPLIRAPAGWRVATLGELAVRIEYGSSVKAGPRAAADDVPIIRMGNIQNGEIDWNKLKYLPGSHPDTSRLLLHDGDLLFNRTNSAELVGKCAVYRNPSTPATFASYLIRCRFGSDVVPEWVALVLNSSLGRAFMMRVASQQVGQANVNGTKLAALPIPLPPAPLQESLLEEMGTWTTSAQRLTTDVMQGLTRAQQLRRSLLGAAFSGQLVQQDPNDEPAELLLKRIRAERAAETPRTRRTRKAKATP